MITRTIPHDAPRVASWYFPHEPEEDAIRAALSQDIADLIAGAKYGVGPTDIDRVAERYFPEGKPRAKEFRDYPGWQD